VVRRGPKGRIYLDARWDDIGLVVEIDGSRHRQGLAVMDDNLRVNSLTTGGETVLRIDLVGLRISPDAYLDQVCAAQMRLSR
jgi:very-short-patch-repair endonuclease